MKTKVRLVHKLKSNKTHQSMFIWYVVCKFQFMEADNFLHPLLPSGGTVRVDVHPLGHLGVRLPGHHPPAVGEHENIYEISVRKCHLSGSMWQMVAGLNTQGKSTLTGIRAWGTIVEIKMRKKSFCWSGLTSQDVWQTRDNIESQ